MTHIILNLTPFERVVAGFLFVLSLSSGTYLAYHSNRGTFVEIPRSGGTLREAIVGTPRFINPLLAISHADKDLTSIVYAGLLTRDESGALIPELAESYTISEDGLTYTFVLREGLTFHDGTQLTAEDVLFTVRQAGNASVRSPVFANWDGVQVEKTDDRTIVFTLPKPYVPFLENLTLGILPAHIWSGLSPEEFPFSQMNSMPVGSGPYRVVTAERDKSGIPSRYRLEKFPSYALGVPYIDTLDFLLFNSEDEAYNAYLKGEVQAVSGITPIHAEEFLSSDTKQTTSVYRTPLLRIFGIFFNHNKQPVFLRVEVREALEIATPKDAVMGEILRGYGTLLNSPVPSFNKPQKSEETVLEQGSEDDAPQTNTNTIEQARRILEDKGWVRDESTGVYSIEKDGEKTPLFISFSTVNTPELMQTAERIAKGWREMGAEVEVKVFEPTDLTQTVIRPRRFDVLLFGMVIGHERDLYAFWHSSQRNDPGLNIAQYADIEADTLLEKMRTEQDPVAQEELYRRFEKLVTEKHSAIFLYAPDLIYMVDDSIRNVSLHPLAEAHERFDTIHTWNIESDNVWPFARSFFE